LHNRCCHGKALSIKYYMSVCHVVALVIWHTNHIFLVTQCIVICGLPGSTIFFCVIFGKKFIEHKMCVLILSAALACNISHSKKSLGDIFINLRKSSHEAPVIPVRL